MNNKTNKLNIAIIGSGNVGTDLLFKCQKSNLLNCSLFVGRRNRSKGLKIAKEMGIEVSDKGIDFLLDNLNYFDLLFDASTAKAHIDHWNRLKVFNKRVIDLTPSNVGHMVIPAINVNEALLYDNISMVSCGGQSSIIIAFAIKESHNAVNYIEVVNAISSKSAGPATRVNIDEYIYTTEKAIKIHTVCSNVKSILIINPANPPINMHTTVYAKVDNPNIHGLSDKIKNMEKQIKKYVKGYKIIISPHFKNEYIVTTASVTGNGDYLPSYAGNLDIINCSAIATAEFISKHLLKSLT